MEPFHTIKYRSVANAQSEELAIEHFKIKEQRPETQGTSEISGHISKVELHANPIRNELYIMDIKKSVAYA